jgi:four helix bundle protein
MAESYALILEVYRLSKAFPPDEQFALTNQIRRAAVSVPSNIAEGHGRLHRADFVRCLAIARGSLMELKTQLEIAEQLGYLSRDFSTDAWATANEVGRLLNGLIRSLSDPEKGGGRIFEASEGYASELSEPRD